MKGFSLLSSKRQDLGKETPMFTREAPVLLSYVSFPLGGGESVFSPPQKSLFLKWWSAGDHSSLIKKDGF